MTVIVGGEETAVPLTVAITVRVVPAATAVKTAVYRSRYGCPQTRPMLPSRWSRSAAQVERDAQSIISVAERVGRLQGDGRGRIDVNLRQRRGDGDRLAQDSADRGRDGESKAVVAGVLVPSLAARV